MQVLKGSCDAAQFAKGKRAHKNEKLRMRYVPYVRSIDALRVNQSVCWCQDLLRRGEKRERESGKGGGEAVIYSIRYKIQDTRYFCIVFGYSVQIGEVWVQPYDTSSTITRLLLSRTTACGTIDTLSLPLSFTIIIIIIIIIFYS